MEKFYHLKLKRGLIILIIMEIFYLESVRIKEFYSSILIITGFAVVYSTFSRALSAF